MKATKRLEALSADNPRARINISDEMGLMTLQVRSECISMHAMGLMMYCGCKDMHAMGRIMYCGWWIDDVP